MWQRLYTLAANTFVETIRQPIYGVILLVTAGLLILNVSLAAFTIDDDDKLLLDLGLSTLLLSGLFLSAFSATGVLSREIQNKTVLTVVSKPISRPLFILGKFAGLLAALVLAFYLGCLVFILAQRHGVLQSTSDPWDAPVLTLGFGSLGVSLVAAAFRNYFYGKHFATSTITFLTPLLTLAVLVVARFDEHWDPIPFASNFVGGQVLIAAYLVLLTVILTATVALAASTRFGPLITLMICTCFLGLGLISDYAFGRYAETSIVASAAYRVMPNVGPFWVVDGLFAETQASAIPFNYVGYATCYAGLWTVGILSVAIVAFQKREVG
jgi:ABC-2 type transport system permease protein